MKKEVADKWVEALRSGKFRQGKQALEYENTYCCLGVLCEIAPGIANRFLSGCLIGVNLSSQGAVQSWSGLQTFWGELGDAGLTELNDSGKTFADIADIIEANWEKL